VPLPIIDFRADLMTVIRAGDQGEPGRPVWEEVRVALDFMGLVIRTDFSDQVAWQEVQARLWAGLEDYANSYTDSVRNGDLGLLLVDSESYAGLADDQAAGLVEEADGDMHTVLFLADNVTMTSQDRILLAVGSREEALENWGEEGRQRWKFRLKPESVAHVHPGVTHNSFSEYYESVDEDSGVYRY
jgi:hypothetical protein